MFACGVKNVTATARSASAFQQPHARLAVPVTARVMPLDAARGMAMFFSVLAHFSYWISVRYVDAGRVLAEIGMIATPTFLLLSGIVAGFVSAPDGTDLQRVRTALFNRGLFVLLAGHFAIALAEAHYDGGLIRAFSNTYPTDTIGVGCILAALLAAKTVPRRWIAACVVAFVASWMIVVFWHPAAESLEGVKQLLVGRYDDDTSVFRYTSPLLQYLAIYAVGLPIGRWLSERRRDNDLLSAGRVLMGWGAVAAASGALLRMLRPLADANLHANVNHILHSSLTIGQKLPPSPAYALFYCGCGVVLTGVFCVLWHYRTGTFVMQRLADVGRASLFVFVLQFFTIFTLPDLLGLAPGPTSPLIFIGNLGLLWVSARLWTAFNGNSWMTLGLRLPRTRAPA
jgi:uncharacterized membrane protein